MKEERTRLLSLITIMAICCASVGGVTVWLLYSSSLNAQKARLFDSAKSQARLIEAIARYDRRYQSQYHLQVGNPLESTLAQVRNAHRVFDGIDGTGEFTLGKRRGNKIHFILSNRDADIAHMKPIPMDSSLAEPMRLALLGKSGAMIGLDYQGKRVLAAYEPVSGLNLGLVSKIDLSEIRRPFVRACLLAGAVALLMIMVGAGLFYRISHPVIKRLAHQTVDLRIINQVLQKEVKERKSAQGALEKSEAKYRFLFENMMHGVAVYDPIEGGKDFIFKDLNSAGEKISRTTRQEVLGQSILKLFPGVKACGIFDVLQHVHRTGKPERLSPRLYQDERISQWVENAVCKIPSGEIVVLYSDETERMNTEELLRKNEERLRLVLEATLDGLWDWNIPSGDIYFSPHCFSMLEYDPYELLHSYETWSGLLHPDDRARVQAAVQAHLAGKMENFETEFRMKKKYGGWKWILSRGKAVAFDDEGKPVRVVGTHVDIHQRKEIEKKLAESEEKHRLVVENANDAIFIVQEERIKFSNPKTERISGYSAEELSKTPFARLIHPEDREMVLARHMKRLRGEKVLSTYSFRIKNKAGQDIWVQLNAVLIRWEGRPATLNFLRDISEEKRLEIQFRQAQKMEAIGRLAGGVAHDFNNLMTAIMGNAELMLMSMDKADPFREDVLEIRKSGERATSLTRQLLAFSRKQVLQPEVCNLNAILEEMEKMLRRLIGEDIDLVTNLHLELGYVRIDPSQMEQVIMNLAINARDAMPMGGRLTIETANVYLDNSYGRDDELVKPGPYVMVAVTDTGEGMEEEIRTKVFDPFFTTKEKGKGTGLGLSTVYGIVTQSGGHIWVYSEPGKGTTFNIYFPEVRQTSSGSKEREPKEVGGGAGSETILLVEDEDTLRNLAVKVLSNLGYTVLDAKGGEEAMEKAERHKGVIDLLLTDVVMGGMNGRELAQRLLQKRPDMKVLFMSGYEDEAVVNQGMHYRGEHFMQKPFTPHVLSQMVRKVINESERQG